MVKILNVSHKISGDEVEVTVTAQNNTPGLSEYGFFLLDSAGTLLDQAPNAYWKNVAPGETFTLSVSSNWDNWNVEDLKPSYTAEVKSQNGLENARVVKQLTPTYEVALPSSQPVQAPSSQPDYSAPTSTGLQTYNPYSYATSWIPQYSSPIITAQSSGTPPSPSGTGTGIFAGLGLFGVIAIIVAGYFLFMKK